MDIASICESKGNRIKIVVGMMLSVILFGVIIVFMDKVLNTGFKCPFHNILNWDCPGCGGSRMLISLLKFDVYQAFRYNSFIMLTMPIVITIFTVESYKFIMHNRVSNYLDKILVFYAASLVLFGIVRNLPGFESLLPTDIT